MSLPNRRHLLRELLKEILIGAKDPVKDCKLYKEQSCAHVDGYLCQYNTCKERIEYERK